MKSKILLTIIVLVAFALRFYHLSIPPLLWDEASIGYNAYSILKTGRDEYGQFLPLIFKSFGDYKPGLYVYLTVPFVALFGLNEVSTRLPSVILGSLLPLLFYFFIKKTTSNQKIALIAAIITVFNPFNIHFSRGAWETNILTFELLLASYLLISNRYLLASLIFTSSFYTYQSAKLITPLIIVILFIVYRPKIKINFFLPLFILSLPLIYGLIFSQNSNRLKVVSLFSYPRSDSETQLIISESNTLDYNLFYNHFVFFGRNFLARYFNHFSFRFLFLEGDWQNPRHNAPYIGFMLYPGLLFLLIGLFSLKTNQKSHIFFLLWLILGPIPSSLTRDSVSAVRSMSFSLPLIYFTALGIYIFISRFQHFFYYALLVTCYLFSFIYYLDLYYQHLVKKFPKDYLYGYQSAISYLLQNQDKYQNIYFTNFYGQAYIYYLFYSHYPPAKYQQQAKLVSTSIDTGVVEKIDRINFAEPSSNKISQTPSSLGIFSHDEVLRQNLDFKKLIPLSRVTDELSTFYAYKNP